MPLPLDLSPDAPWKQRFRITSLHYGDANLVDDLAPAPAELEL